MDRAAATPFPIAIDGPAASGKTTLGRSLARELRCSFLDTGLMYRAFTLAALRGSVPSADEVACAALAAKLDLRLAGEPEARVVLAHEDVTDLLRDPAVEHNVSAYSAIAAVRKALVRKQRAFAASRPVVLAGRDIGTVVLPDAPLKFFLEASPEARSRRRSKQAADWGQSSDVRVAASDIAGRDEVDSSRIESPLRPANDAIVLDTTTLTAEQVLAVALEQVRRVQLREVTS